MLLSWSTTYRAIGRTAHSGWQEDAMLQEHQETANPLQHAWVESSSLQSSRLDIARKYPQLKNYYLHFLNVQNSLESDLHVLKSPVLNLSVNSNELELHYRTAFELIRIRITARLRCYRISYAMLKKRRVLLGHYCILVLRIWLRLRRACVGCSKKLSIRDQKRVFSEKSIF